MALSTSPDALRIHFEARDAQRFQLWFPPRRVIDEWQRSSPDPSRPPVAHVRWPAGAAYGPFCRVEAQASIGRDPRAKLLLVVSGAATDWKGALPRWFPALHDRLAEWLPNRWSFPLSITHANFDSNDWADAISVGVADPGAKLETKRPAIPGSDF